MIISLIFKLSLTFINTCTYLAKHVNVMLLLLVLKTSRERIKSLPVIFHILYICNIMSLSVHVFMYLGFVQWDVVLASQRSEMRQMRYTRYTHNVTKCTAQIFNLTV